MIALVTGATGFVGSAVARLLIAEGFQVRVLARKTSSLSNVEDLPVELVYGDLTDYQSLCLALRGCDCLFHVAADYRLWVPRPEEIYRNNVQGTVNIMEAAIKEGVKRVVYTSSVATLGLNNDGSPAHEETPVTLADMIGHYKRSKYLAEEEVRKLVRQKGLDAVIVNPSTPAGPRDIKPTPTGRMILEAAQGKMPAYVDTGLNMVHVEDVAIGHLLAFHRGETGKRYILGGENLTLKEIFTIISKITGGTPPRISLPHNLILPVAYAAEAWAKISGREPMVTVDGVKLARKKMFFSIEKAKRELGYQPRPAAKALEDAVNWFRAQGMV
ncbi:MAG: NAD-dependent dehydratase [Thermodesulfatator sp.]|nr:MAG: NAD-dependent dehydratase [Thermodesulfatator sp.]